MKRIAIALIVLLLAYAADLLFAIAVSGGAGFSLRPCMLYSECRWPSNSCI